MIRATVDTSSLAPSIRRVGHAQNRLPPIMQAWRAREFEWVLSEHILTELGRTLDTPYFSRYLIAADRLAAIAKGPARINFPIWSGRPGRSVERGLA